jgi:hypothetical protein
MPEARRGCGFERYRTVIVLGAGRAQGDLALEGFLQQR